MSEIEAAEAASRAAAEETVGRWLGGPFSIPTYIVICESGGNYGAVNPSSGAGGAYQILPSTWSLYGGRGAPQDASKEEQDRIAAEIWADSGPRRLGLRRLSAGAGEGRPASKGLLCSCARSEARRRGDPRAGRRRKPSAGRGCACRRASSSATST